MTIPAEGAAFDPQPELKLWLLFMALEGLGSIWFIWFRLEEIREAVRSLVPPTLWFDFPPPPRDIGASGD